MFPKALERVRVLELGQGISGPYCGKLLACMGADVTKIEPPSQGDCSRGMGPFFHLPPHIETSPAYLYLNTGKKSVTLDIRQPSGVEILKKLLPRADVLVENYRPGVMASLGLDYPDLEAINHRLVMASITYFGQTGPYKDYKGNSMIGYAVTGQMYMNGEMDREPLVGAGYQPEYQAGLHAFDAILAALFWREVEGQGQHIDISVMESMAYYHEYALTAWSYVNAVNIRAGNRYPTGNHPNTMYPCKDGYISITCVTPRQVENVFKLFERPELLDDPRYATRFARWEHADELDEMFLPWLKERTMDEVVARAQDLRIPCSAGPTFKQLFADNQLSARDFWVEIEHPLAGRQTYAGAPYKMSETPWQVARAPLLGEHNDEVYLDELGLSREEMMALEDGDVI